MEDALRAPISSPKFGSPRPPSSGYFATSHTFRGEISGREDLYIDGAVEGEIHLEGAQLVIGPNSRVHAHVEAGEIVVLGKVKGNLHGTDSVRIAPTGHVVGDVMTPRLIIETGALVQGNVDVTAKEKALRASN